MQGSTIDGNDLSSIYPSVSSLEELVIEDRFRILLEAADVSLVDGLVAKGESTSQLLQPSGEAGDPIEMFLTTLTQELNEITGDAAQPHLGPWDDLAIAAMDLSGQVSDPNALELRTFSEEVSTLLDEHRAVADYGATSIEGDVADVELAVEECGGFGTPTADPDTQETLAWIDDNQQDLEDLGE